jgi:hypothetical protein
MDCENPSSGKADTVYGRPSHEPPEIEEDSVQGLSHIFNRPNRIPIDSEFNRLQYIIKIYSIPTQCKRSVSKKLIRRKEIPQNAGGNL